MERLKNVSTKKLSEFYGIPHRTITDDAESLISTNIFAKKLILPSTYKSKQGKKIKCFEMCKDGFLLLIEKSGYKNFKNHMKTYSMLLQLGIDPKDLAPKISMKLRAFRSQIIMFEQGRNIHLAYPLAGVLVDVCLPEYGIVIEYQENCSFSKKALKEKEKNRVKIKEYLNEKFGDESSLIIVPEGGEINFFVHFLLEIEKKTDMKKWLLARSETY